ncbi:MAG: 50S ribosomal protein L19e [Nanoarchaeota archaeon]|nr:50S ribosomal protein L19e [Nanoarchaeota archaeon]MBU1632758.1 50S ribosomal protein L19e [Nanoarchaeota archaeon]MBU1876509.1 50S ribosomal protein L19e [Nanoarchaeota archaeon]
MKNKKKLAAKIMKVSPKKVKFVADALEDIKKAITRSDFRGLIAVKKIVKSGKNESSRSGARKIAAQKRKGRRKGKGTKKGSKHSIVSKKEKWINKIRAQRIFLKELSDKNLVSKKDYHMLYSKSKGGYFRNKRHIKLYLKEHYLIQEKK